MTILTNIPLSGQLAKFNIDSYLINHWQSTISAINHLNAVNVISTLQARKYRRQISREIRKKIQTIVKKEGAEWKI